MSELLLALGEHVREEDVEHGRVHERIEPGDEGEVEAEVEAVRHAEGEEATALKTKVGDEAEEESLHEEADRVQGNEARVPQPGEGERAGAEEGEGVLWVAQNLDGAPGQGKNPGLRAGLQLRDRAPDGRVSDAVCRCAGTERRTSG